MIFAAPKASPQMAKPIPQPVRINWIPKPGGHASRQTMASGQGMRFLYHNPAESAMKIISARVVSAALAALSLSACAHGGLAPPAAFPAPPVDPNWHCPKAAQLPEKPKLSDVLTAGLQTQQALAECSAANEAWRQWWADQAANAGK